MKQVSVPKRRALVACMELGVVKEEKNPPRVEYGTWPDIAPPLTAIEIRTTARELTKIHENSIINIIQPYPLVHSINTYNLGWNSAGEPLEMSLRSWCPK